MSGCLKILLINPQQGRLNRELKRYLCYRQKNLLFDLFLSEILDENFRLNQFLLFLKMPSS